MSSRSDARLYRYGTGLGRTIRRTITRLRLVLRLAPTSATAAVLAARRRPAGPIPPAPLSARSMLEVGVDEVLITAQSFVRSVPHVVELRRHLLDVEAAAGALDGRDLRSAFPRVDSSPAEVALRSRFGLRWEQITFPGPVALPAPLADTWAAAHGATASPARLRVLRHGEPRPWVIVVHGAQQGTDFDLRALRVRHLHDELGLNVALPVLPLHGPRRPAGVAFVPGFDVLLNVGTALLAVSEIAAARTWMAEQADTPIGLFGVSLGGYIAGLAAGVVPAIDVVIAAMPVVSVHRLLARHLSRAGGGDALQLAALIRSEPVMALERFVDPLAYEPTVPIPQRHVIGGLLDRVTTPHQAVQLAEHWRVPTVRWYPGGHIGHAWSSSMRADVDLALGRLHDTHLHRSESQQERTTDETTVRNRRALPRHGDAFMAPARRRADHP